jgi:hypothetical protein
MNVEIGAEAAQFPEKEYINGIAVAVYVLQVVTCACAAVLAVILTAMVAINYATGPSYDTGFNVDTKSGLIAFPDLLICTSAAWDTDQARRLNIRDQSF